MANILIDKAWSYDPEPFDPMVIISFEKSVRWLGTETLKIKCALDEQAKNRKGASQSKYWAKIVFHNYYAAKYRNYLVVFRFDRVRRTYHAVSTAAEI